VNIPCSPQAHGRRLVATHLGWGVDFDLASRLSLEDFAKQHVLSIGSWRVVQQAPSAGGGSARRTVRAR
jgi:hypothetical protein